MIDTIEDYDALLTAIYRAGRGEAPIADMLLDLHRAFDAAAAGFSIYDDPGERITHTLVSPTTPPAADQLRQVSQMNDDPGARLFSRKRLAEPRRMTDVIPAARLKTSGWFRLQEEIAGVSHCAAMDLDISGLRVRLFILNASGAPDFRAEQLDLLGRLGRHVERAFNGQLRLLAPSSAFAGVTTLVFRRDDLAAQMIPGDAVERHLIARYGLTAAEARIAVSAASGHTRADIAARAGISINTLKTHMRRLYGKLGISRSADLILMLSRLQPRQP